MAISTTARRDAIAAQARQELDALEARGVWFTGNGYSPILLVKGELNDAERAGGELLAGADGHALRAALTAIGWAPEDFCALATALAPDAGDGAAAASAGVSATGAAPTEDAVSAAGAAPTGGIVPLDVDTFREAVEAVDPEAVVLLDDAAADAMREAYADALAIIDDFDTAMLSPGLVASVAGRRVLAVGGFEAALSDPHKKQVAWAYLKQLAPLGAPY